MVTAVHETSRHPKLVIGLVRHELLPSVALAMIVVPSETLATGVSWTNTLSFVALALLCAPVVDVGFAEAEEEEEDGENVESHVCAGGVHVGR